jgi:hypothetical protein
VDINTETKFSRLGVGCKAKKIIVVNSKEVKTELFNSRQPGKLNKDLKIGTWNVRPRALKMLLDQLKIYTSRTDLTCIQEIGWNGTGVIEKKKYTVFFIDSTMKSTNWELAMLLVKEFRTL